MKTISLILLVAAVIQITLTAPASDVPTTTTITPLGSMDMGQLVEYYKKYEYHIYDVIAPEAIRLIKIVLEILDDIIASPDNSDAETEIYQQFKNHFTDYLKDVEADVTECSLKQLAYYYHHHIKDFAKSADNEKLRELFKTFNDDLTVSYRAIRRVNMEFIQDNMPIWEEVEKKVKFSTRCCKYWHKSYRADRINGDC